MKANLRGELKNALYILLGLFFAAAGFYALMSGQTAALDLNAVPSLRVMTMGN